MYSYFFDSTKTQHPTIHLDIHNFEDLPTLKMLFYYF